MVPPCVTDPYCAWLALRQVGLFRVLLYQRHPPGKSELYLCKSLLLELTGKRVSYQLCPLWPPRLAFVSVSFLFALAAYKAALSWVLTLPAPPAQRSGSGLNILIDPSSQAAGRAWTPRHGRAEDHWNVIVRH
jgi:hypothetical protein